MEKILIKNESGEQIVGLLEGNVSSGKLVVLCHGSRGSRESPLIRFLAEGVGKDYAVFSFDFSGNGESEGRIEEATYSKGISDLDSVLEYFEDYDIVCVVGHSKSATEVLIAEESLSKHVDLVIAISPRIDVRKSQEYEYYEKNKDKFLEDGFLTYPSKIKFVISGEFLKDVEKYFGLSDCFEKVLPTVIFHGREDDVIPVESSRIFSKKHGVDFFEIEGASHSYTSYASKNKLLGSVLDSLGTLSE